MKLLVTGGSGYIGTAFIKRMIEDGHQIRCIDKRVFNENCLQNFSDYFTNFEMIIGDIRIERDLRKVLKDIDAVVNFAAIVGSPSCAKDQKEAWSVNVNGVALLSKLTPKETPIVQLSTCSVYGNVKRKICDENDKPKPLTLYAETKLEAEKIILEHNGVVLRPVTVFGPSPSPRFDLFLHTLICFGLKKKKFSLFEPQAIRPMVFIDDIVNAVRFSLINNRLMSSNIYNIGSDNDELTKLELVQKVKRLTNLQFDVIENQSDPDGRDYSISWAKIQELGFKLNTSIDLGLLQTKDWISNELIKQL